MNTITGDVIGEISTFGQLHWWTLVALLCALLLFKFYQPNSTNLKNTPMTAHITYRVNPHYPRATAHQECCICGGAIGLYIFYYDRGDKHYTGACHDCIGSLRVEAKKLYVVKETYSKYAPTKYSPQTVVSKMKIFDGPRPCGACDQHMINYVYSVDTPNAQYKDICFYCVERLKYKARTNGHRIDLNVVKAAPSVGVDTPRIKTYPKEHRTSFMVICSKCFKHTFEYKAWSYGDVTGLCESCACNM